VTAFIERVYHSLMYEVAFMISAGPDAKGMCLMMNPNAAPLTPESRYLLHETAMFPEGKTLRLTQGKLDELADTPDEDLAIGGIDIATKKAWNDMRLCAKCRGSK